MNIVLKRTGVAALALGVATLFAGPVMAGEPAGVIQYRQKVMSAIGGHMGGIGAILKNKLPQTAHIEKHAGALAELAAMIPDIFPKGSGEGKTDALPSVWKDFKGFNAAASKLEEEAGKLAKVAMGGGDVGAQVKKVGKACGGCHKEYRQPKKKRYSWKKKM
jgi:cytochrome c556